MREVLLNSVTVAKLSMDFQISMISVLDKVNSEFPDIAHSVRLDKILLTKNM